MVIACVFPVGLYGICLFVTALFIHLTNRQYIRQKLDIMHERWNAPEQRFWLSAD